MNKIVGNLLVFFIIGYSAAAQKPVEKADFDKIINKISYEFALQSISDDVTHLAAFLEKLAPVCGEKACCDDKCNFEMKEFLKAQKVTATANLCSYIESYKAKYQEGLNGKEQYNIVAGILSDSLQVKSFIDKRASDSNFNAKLTALYKEINETFDYNGDVPSSPTANVTEPSDARTKADASSSGMGMLGWLSTILLIASIGGYMLLLRPKYQKRLAELKQKIKDLDAQVTQLAAKNNTLQEEVTDLKHKNDALFENENMLRDQLAKFTQKEKQAKKDMERPKKIMPEYPTNEEGLTVYDTFFMPVPNRDGSFEDNHKSNKFEWTESVYKFEVINSERTKAVFSIVNDNRMIKRAMSGYDVYIKPVCRGTNAFNMNATIILTEEKGKVTLNGSTWLLDEKAAISYQN